MNNLNCELNHKRKSFDSELKTPTPTKELKIINPINVPVQSYSLQNIENTNQIEMNETKKLDSYRYERMESKISKNDFEISNSHIKSSRNSSLTNDELICSSDQNYSKKSNSK